MDNLIDNKYQQFNNNKINALQLIGEIYEPDNLCNYHRDYIINHCSGDAINKMISISYNDVTDALVSASIM
tara:strand:- start:4157 stop:4369 length:213 start_codon:yes stop_codon:yes gene_type:complete